MSDAALPAADREWPGRARRPLAAPDACRRRRLTDDARRLTRIGSMLEAIGNRFTPLIVPLARGYDLVTIGARWKARI